MAARRAPAAPQKPSQRRTIVKALAVGNQDADALVGTIADSNSQKIPNAEIYWFAYEKHPWIRAVVRIIANAVSQEGFSVAKAEGADFTTLSADEDERVTEIFEFWRFAFNGQSFRHAIKALAVDLEVFAVAYWLRHKQGDLLWFERLDPRLVDPRLAEDRASIKEYKLRRKAVTEAGIIISQTETTIIPADDMVRFCFEGGDAVLGGPSPLEALDLTTSIDMEIRKHRRSFFSNGATAGTYIVLPDGNEDSVRAVEKQFRSMKTGTRNAYKPVIIAGQNASVTKATDSGKQEVDFVKGTEISRDEICAVYSVPPGKLLFSDGALGSAGKNQDDDTFQRDCVLPLEELIYERLTQIMVEEFDIRDLVLVPKRRNAIRLDRFPAAMQLVQFGGTGNQALEFVGLPKSDLPGMDIPLFLSSKGQSLEAEEPVPQPAPEGNEDAITNTNDANEVASKAKAAFRRKRLRY